MTSYSLCLATVIIMDVVTNVMIEELELLKHGKYQIFYKYFKIISSLLDMITHAILSQNLQLKVVPT